VATKKIFFSVLVGLFAFLGIRHGSPWSPALFVLEPSHELSYLWIDEFSQVTHLESGYLSPAPVLLSCALPQLP
jgi:hypothetical protein